MSLQGGYMTRPIVEASESESNEERSRLGVDFVKCSVVAVRRAQLLEPMGLCDEALTGHDRQRNRTCYTT